MTVSVCRAALTDSFYSSGMCVGRLISTWLSTFLQPSSLLPLGMGGCLLGNPPTHPSLWHLSAGTLLLLLLAPSYSLSLYCGVTIMGLFVSWQFATGFSWTSHHMNITGRLSSIFFIGLGVGRYFAASLPLYSLVS